MGYSEATKAKKREQSARYWEGVAERIRDFYNEKTVTDWEGRLRSTELYSVYKQWCADRHKTAQSVRIFGEVSATIYDKVKSHGVTWYRGVSLKNDLDRH